MRRNMQRSVSYILVVRDDLTFAVINGIQAEFW